MFTSRMPAELLWNTALKLQHFFQRVVDNMKKSGLKGYVYGFSVDYNAIVVADILDIHKYLMKKNGIV